MTQPDANVERSATADLHARDLESIRLLMTAAFGDEFSDEDWEHATGGTHFFLRDSGGSMVSHAAVVERRLEASGVPLATGYVEAVATRPDVQGKGLGTAVMRSVAAFLHEHFELGALSTGTPGFYERLGWIRWRGPTWCREEGRLVRTADEDGGVLVLPTSGGPQLDVEGDLAVEWRSGDVW